MTSTSSDTQRRARAARGNGAALGREIVSTAMEVVDESGAVSLSLRGLARRIGVSAPAIYTHFPDIDAILLAVAEQAFDDLAAHLRSATAGAKANGTLLAVCSAYLHYAQANPGRYLVMFGGQWDATSAAQRGSVTPEAVAALGHDVLMLITDAVNQNRRQGVVSPDVSALDDAVMTWVTLHGYAHQRLVARAFPWPAAMTELFLDRVTAPTARCGNDDDQRYANPS